MKLGIKLQSIAIFILCIAVLFSCSALGVKVVENKDGNFIKWMTFDIPYSALNSAMNVDIKTHGSPQHVDWIELLACLGTKYGGNWKKYSSGDLDALAEKLKNGATVEDLKLPVKYYNYYYETYDAVLAGFLGQYKALSTSGGSLTDNYGLIAYSPIAKGYGYSHYDDFGDSRSFGFNRRHLGNDLMGNIGTPIVAVESGYVESLGWNRYGGWRIGIRSFDHKRYYYYAHLRKNHPYVADLKQGMLVKAGEVIGYLGMTGYSTEENVNNMQKPHLHFGMQIIFDESQKEGNGEIWIDVYDIVDLLSRKRAPVTKDPLTGDYHSLIY